MLNVTPRLTRLLAPALFAGALSAPAAAQIEALRESDDQFIQGLREQGMSDLLERFVETDPPEDPIAKLALDIALKEFIADDLLKRASEANQAGDFMGANTLFNDSRLAFEQVLAAQRKLTEQHRDDERLPLWQTDLAQMLLFQYLPRYHANASWHYEFGLPTDAQREAFESVMVEALVLSADAAYRLDELSSRVAADGQLRIKLEEIGIWFKLNDYRSVNTPYWLAQAAHGVSLLPATNRYYNNKLVNNQRPDAAAERKRLRNLVVDVSSGRLMSDERTELVAKLYSGLTLVWSDDVDDVDEGVDGFLEDVISASPNTYHGYLATLGKAVGRKQAGELDVALEILGGMHRHPYVEADGTTTARLLAADLMYRMLIEQAEQAPEAERSAKVAEAYERAYVPLIEGNQDDRYRNQLFARWADSAGEVDDPASLPPAVRMGIGERLTQQGGYQAQIIVQTMQSPPPAIPTEAQQRAEQLAQQRTEADALLNRAALFNSTLVGEEMEGAVLARGLFNLGQNRYWLAELAKVFNGGQTDWRPYLEVAQLWLQVGERVPDAAQAQQALFWSLGLSANIDFNFNRDAVSQPEVRDAYRGAFELLNERWPQNEAAHNNRVYAGFYLYEKAGDLDQAIAVYRALPSSHKDYFQARRQMIYALQRQYRSLSDELLLLEATQPADAPPPGATADQRAALEQAKLDWQRQTAALGEELERRRGDITEEAELVILDAEDEVDNAPDPARRFSAATALGAATVVLAGMEADAGNPDNAKQLLEGYEERFAPDGPYAQLASLQQDPELAAANLQGLVQTAQEQRILTLLDAGQNDQMVAQARAMMDASPDVAASVVNGVLNRIEATIERERRAEREAAFQSQRDRASANIKYQADGAVELGKLLLAWAEGRGYTAQQMVAYQMPLAESLMLADDADNALAIMQPLSEQFPNNFGVSMMTGKANLAVFRDSKKVEHYNGAMEQFSKIIAYYNQRIEKPEQFWEAWLNVCLLLEAYGGDQAASIPREARKLLRVDEDLGGPAFKPRFEEIFDRNGGVERLQQP